MKHAMLYVRHGNAFKKARELKDLLEKRVNMLKLI